MPRVDLEQYYKGSFKTDDSKAYEQFKKINGGHAISSNYYDIQFGRCSLIYRDKIHNFVIPVEHDITHTLVICLSYFFENNECDIAEATLKNRIDAALNFLRVKHRVD